MLPAKREPCWAVLSMWRDYFLDPRFTLFYVPAYAGIDIGSDVTGVSCRGRHAKNIAWVRLRFCRDRDAVLSEAEVDATRWVCAGTDSLVETSSTEVCAGGVGGMLVKIGRDTNGNGQYH